MRVATFEGYGDLSVTEKAAVDKLIRDQIAILMQVQRTLWDAYGKWKSGQFWIGIAIPAVRLLQIAKYDYKYSVDSWQASVDVWWASRMTDTVRASPYEKGTDGRTRIEAWTKYGSGLVEWAKRISDQMGDDDVGRLFTDFGKALTDVTKTAINYGIKIPLSIIPDWVKWAAGGFGALYLYTTFFRRN